MTWSPDYVDLETMRRFKDIPDNLDDLELANFITSASRAIDLRTNRQFGRVETVEERFYCAHWDRNRPRPAWVVEIDDIATTTGMVVSVGGNVVTHFTMEPRNAIQKGKVWTHLVFDADAEFSPVGPDYEVSIVGLWGWPSFPAGIELGCKLQVSRFIVRRVSPFGIAGSPEQGNELRLLAKLDPDVEVAVMPYVRWWGAA